MTPTVKLTGLEPATERDDLLATALFRRVGPRQRSKGRLPCAGLAVG
jgi:hypothetical protein